MSVVSSQQKLDYQNQSSWGTWQSATCEIILYLNPLFAGEWRASKGKASLPGIFPCDTAAAANARRAGWQQQLQHHCPCCSVPRPSWGILTRTGWLATWRAQMGEWQPPAAAVEPAAITVTSHGVLLCMCIRATVPLPFPLHWHAHTASKAAKLKIMFPQGPLPGWWCGPRVINQISDLHFAIFQEMLSTLHAEWRHDGLFSLTVCVGFGLLRSCKFLLWVTSTAEFPKLSGIAICHTRLSLLTSQLDLLLLLQCFLLPWLPLLSNSINSPN